MRALLTLDFAATVWDGALLPRRELGRVNEVPSMVSNIEIM